jgi:putative aldouronate transport system permease protein
MFLRRGCLKTKLINLKTRYFSTLNLKRRISLNTKIHKEQAFIFKRITKNRLKIAENIQLYLLVFPSIIYFLLMKYWPMYGVQIAFRDFNFALGISKSPWIGLSNFKDFFESFYFWTLMKNTIGLSIYSIAVNFPIPIVFALILNEIGNKTFKRFVQTLSYAPHFISTVVMCGMIINFLSPTIGLVNRIIVLLGGQSQPFMIMHKWFKSIYVFSDIWQNMGWSAIIYLAALSNVDLQLIEAATIDGATRIQKIRYINIPSIISTITILFILRLGSVMNVGFEKVFLLQNPLNLESSDVISTYVYRRGLVQAEFSFSTAVGFFNSAINFVLIIFANSITKKFAETSLW